MNTVYKHKTETLNDKAEITTITAIIIKIIKMNLLERGFEYLV